MITVHLIGNAHLDPVWLWRWPAGIGEALATCRSAVQRLQETPEFVFTRSDQWLYEQIERLDPDLFEQIRRYVAEGRWQIVGGWYVQPDCNLPMAESFRKHMQLGKQYFRRKFGVDVTVGYNVDSFGHNAMLPSLLREAGYDSYVMMRPSPSEKALPSALFRWRSPDGSEVLVWRIVNSYTCWDVDLTKHIQAALDMADPEIGHVMCFYGVGDHGGGPTRRQLAWLLEHQDHFPGARLQFSHPRAFFDAVEPFRDRLPVVEDELQYHAIGCYSVVRTVKHHVRRAEHGLLRAQIACEMFPDQAPPGAPDQLDEAWKKVLFNQFHDIYAGTSLAEAYEDARDQLGAAYDTAETVLVETLFRHLRTLPGDSRQRIVVFNPSDRPFQGYLEHEPWLGWGAFKGWLADEQGQAVPYQRIPHPSVTGREARSILWPAEIPPRGQRVYALCDGASPAPSLGTLRVNAQGLENDHWRVKVGEGAALVHVYRAATDEPLFGSDGLGLEVRYDTSDTWSHGRDGFREPVLGRFQLQEIHIDERGPIRASLRLRAAYEQSALTLWIRLYAGDPRLELRLWLDWRQHLQIAKLCLPFASAIQTRSDGIPGAFLKRPQNGQEYPLHDGVHLTLADGTSLAVAAPDCFSVDATPERLGLTLVRSPVYAWHDPAQLSSKTFYRYTDQGEHLFRFWLQETPDPETVRNLAWAAYRPPVCLDWTMGMGSEGTTE